MVESADNTFTRNLLKRPSKHEKIGKKILRSLVDRRYGSKHCLRRF